MQTENDKEKKSKEQCCDFGPELFNFQEISEKMKTYCSQQDGPMECMALMKKYCGSKTKKDKPDTSKCC